MLVLLFVLGTLIGSFLNVCIYRLPRGESVAAPPSHCPNCNTRLKPLDLVPLLSQTFLRARCRYCGHPISWRYFGIELLTGILFVLAGMWAGPLGFDADAGIWVGDWVKLVQGLVFMATLVVIFWVDYDTRLVPLEPVFSARFRRSGARCVAEISRSKRRFDRRFHQWRFVERCVDFARRTAAIAVGDDFLRGDFVGVARSFFMALWPRSVRIWRCDDRGRHRRESVAGIRRCGRLRLLRWCSVR